jgi:hypothetical protein
LCDIFGKRKYKLTSSNQSILPYCTLRHITIEINHGSQNGYVKISNISKIYS